MSSDREALRRAARRRRKQAAAHGDRALAQLAERFLAAVPWSSQQTVAGYSPTGSEIDDRPLLDALRQQGCTVALPCVIAEAQPLVFRLWREDDALIDGPFAIPQPPASSPEIRPDLVLVPLLAVDQHGHRLGSGLGFYDRTLEMLRRGPEVLAVGVAYEGQRVDTLPTLATDQALDWLVTDQTAARFA